jgi:cysteine dioxygenase
MGDDEFVSTMERFARRFGEYRDRLPAIPRAYSRTRLARTPAYEIVAMLWAPGSVSPIHDHGTSRCWVVMLAGTLDVVNFACAGDGSATIHQTERLVLNPGDIDHRLGPGELHRVSNPDASEGAYSLQLYARPLTTYSIVDANSHQRRTATATCELELLLD